MAGTGVSREQGGVLSVMKDRENPRNTLQERREQELASDRGKWDSCVEQVRSRVFSGVRRGCAHVVTAARTHSPLHTAGAKPGRQERTGRVEGIGQDRTGQDGVERAGQDRMWWRGQDRTGPHEHPVCPRLALLLSTRGPEPTPVCECPGAPARA